MFKVNTLFCLFIANFEHVIAGWFPNYLDAKTHKNLLKEFL